MSILNTSNTVFEVFANTFLWKVFCIWSIWNTLGFFYVFSNTFSNTFEDTTNVDDQKQMLVWISCIHIQIMKHSTVKATDWYRNSGRLLFRQQRVNSLTVGSFVIESSS